MSETVRWDDTMNAWMVTGYDEIAMALKAPGLSAARMVGELDLLPAGQRAELAPLRASVARWMGHTNRDDHVRMQRVIKRYFSPSTVEGLRPRVEAITHELLDAFRGRHEAEIVTELARPLPARVIADMLGVPDRDRDLLPAWSRDISAVFAPFDMEQLRQSQRSIVEMSEYMRPIVAARRAEPRADLISQLLAAQAEGMIRDDEEILANCVLLLFAGHETTAGLIANGLHLLLTHTDQFDRLRAEPALLGTAIEEMLRYAGPAGATTRLALAETEIGGCPVKPEQLVVTVLAAGNRDPKLCPEPERFDIARPASRHLAFGQGTFYCLGAPLARLEARVCFTAMFDRLDGLALHPDGATEERRSAFGVALERLPVTFTAAR
jgi:cytochrome P450